MNDGADVFSVEPGPGGMPTVRVKTALASADIALQGAHLLSWQPAGEEPVIWVSPNASYAPGKSVRGGIPVCWPWFGAHGTEPGFPAHGFARTTDWELQETELLGDGRARVRFGIVLDDKTRGWWPHACSLHLEFLIGRQLQCVLETRNLDAKAFTITQALHTYFRVADVRDIVIDGLQGCDYLDKVLNFAKGHQTGPLTVAGEVDRIYLHTPASCRIKDSKLARTIVIDSSGSHSTVVWNPWQATSEKMGDMGEQGYLDMVCVETANAATDAVRIEPGTAHRLAVTYTCERD